MTQMLREGGPNAELIGKYLQATQDPIHTIAYSLWSLDDLDAPYSVKMNNLQLQWREEMEKTIKTRLKKVDFDIQYDSINAICGTERIEAVSAVSINIAQPAIPLVLTIVPRASYPSSH